MAIEKAKRMSMRVPLCIAATGVFACALSWLGFGVYLYWNDVKLINFLAAWIPFVLSILLAFVPEREMSLPKRLLWRSSVIGVGFIWSVVLWHQQVITEGTAKKDQENIVTRAIAEANKHSDAQIAGVKSEIQTTNSKIEQLPSKISSEIDTNTAMLTKAFVKVNPYALTHAQLQFSLFVKGIDKFPLTDYYFPREDDGSVNVQFYVKNVSEDTSTGKGDLWTQICHGCSYPKDPSGFVKREGADEHIRHKTFEFLNAGIAFEPMLLPVQPPNGESVFQVSFMYSCETCGGLKSWQTATVRTTSTPVMQSIQPARPKKAKRTRP